MESSLTPDQTQSLTEWLETFPEKTRTKGQNYFVEGRVHRAEPYQRGIGYKGEIQGSYATYSTKVRQVKGQWEAVCSCPVGSRCKHCVALMFYMLSLSDKAEETPVVDAGVVPVASEPPGDDGEPTTVVERLTKRLGRKLDQSERRVAKAVSHIFEHYRETKGVPEMELAPILGERAGWQWKTAELWPAPPRNEWETWLYILHHLRKHQRKPVYTLLPAVNWNEVDALVGDWERLQEVARWRNWLTRTADQMENESLEWELRVRLKEAGIQLEGRKDRGEFQAVKENAFANLTRDSFEGRLRLDAESQGIWQAFNLGYGAVPQMAYTDRDCHRVMNNFLRGPHSPERVVGPDGAPMQWRKEGVQWKVTTPEGPKGNYRFVLVRQDGSELPPAMVVVDGIPPLYITRDAIFEAPPVGGLNPLKGAVEIPREAVETTGGVALFERIGAGLPEPLAERVETIDVRVVFQFELWRDAWGSSERVVASVLARGNDVVFDRYVKEGWQRVAKGDEGEHGGKLIRYRQAAKSQVPALVEALRMNWSSTDSRWQRSVGKNFPQMFTEWLEQLPRGVDLELDEELSSLRNAPITARVSLEVEEAGIDWFDLKVALDVKDTTLTKAELRALLDARGGFVRLKGKGWRRLQFEISSEDEAQLADLGLNARDFSAEPQRLHALQLAGKEAAKRLLPEPQARAIERRVEEIRTRVSPAVPAAISAQLRPYQVEGYHFLAYLAENRFGGILADDMGLGKTLQTLTWLMWLRSTREFKGYPSLVVCPKSVMDNWRSEAGRFASGLRVSVLPRGAKEETLRELRAGNDLLVMNYAQLRTLEKELSAEPWHAIILDEAQAIKNPDSQTARVAWGLKAAHRLALSGTPIENKLLDLWSIMAFAMPGVLGQRGAFGKTFDQRSDPNARRRLAARVRPFVLRRTKNEVAKDLPARIEEDLLCELDGPQGTLYRAELKRARAALLKITTKAQLDEQRFNILTSLLRLRQICCHPALIGGNKEDAESAKFAALFDLLEPLMEEGHKVLVFSQFVEMLDLIRNEIRRRDWPLFYLTGATEDRGQLVRDFQATEGAGVFLLSLRAGGFGLNLTAASYVVLYDPWWNPAVENQAIDRTHRIGQTNQVIAYRLLIKDSIEEKIRTLQKQKSALAEDILGEENLTRALTLEDFRFLLGEE